MPLSDHQGLVFLSGYYTARLGLLLGLQPSCLHCSWHEEEGLRRRALFL